ncbi:hypothetical protein BC943DRAFT_349688 [Umbelopsis sp. AD052]|nr:hypothetical protein BC943DRAFT_349688 [Umbelopsis sp. AD052]
MARSNTDQNHTALHYFASIGQVQALKILLNCGFDIHSTDSNHNTALHYAAKTDQCNVITLLLEQGLDINVRNNEGETALHVATEKDFLDLASMLIVNSIDIEAKLINTGSTALCIAVQNNNLKLITLMLRRSIDVNSKNIAGETALHLAAQNGLLSVCTLLIEHGANVNSDDKSQAPPLYNGVASFDPDIVRLLLDHNASVDEHDYFDNIVSFAIAEANDRVGYLDEHKFITVIRLLVNAGADTTEITLNEESKTRFPILQDILSRSSDRPLDVERQLFKRPKVILNEDIEANNPTIDSTEHILRRDGHKIGNEHSSGLCDERWLNHTKNKYGYGFPLSKRHQLDNLLDITELGILSIAGGDELVEKLVAAILDVKVEPTEISSQNEAPAGWKIRNRPAAKAVGIDIWGNRREQIVNRVWDLHQDKLVNNIDAREVIFITHRWNKIEVRQLVECQTNCAESGRLYESIHNKSNLVELDEAIRSMYKWYASCAAVLLDSGTPLDVWCKRGWCLQEGAAAGLLCGISKEGTLVTIQELANEQNHKLCTLDLHLYYREGNAAEILARMAIRETTREEDMAYALAGIFSLHLPLAYGEGLESRGRLLHQLAISKGDLSFLSFQNTQVKFSSYLPDICEVKHSIAICKRASVPINVSHFGTLIEVQLIKEQDAKNVLQKLKSWKDLKFAKEYFWHIGDDHLMP